MNDNTIQELAPVPPQGLFGLSKEEIAFIIWVIVTLIPIIGRMWAARKDNGNIKNLLAAYALGSAQTEAQKLPKPTAEEKPAVTDAANAK